MSEFFNRVLNIAENFASLIVVPKTDALVDAGKLFGTSPIITTPGGSKSYLSLTTGSTRNTHAYINFLATGEEIVNVYLNPTITTPGTLVPIANFNLTSPNVPHIEIRNAPIVGDVGSKIADFLMVGGSTGNAVGSASSNATEVVLPPSTTFLFEVDNTTGQQHLTEITINFYEVLIGY